MLFNDLFKQTNVELEQKNSNISKDSELITKASQWLTDKDNYNHKPNINIIVQVISPDSHKILDLFGGSFQIYGPTILDRYVVELYPDKDSKQFYELWLSNDMKKTDYLVKGDQVLGQINDKKLHNRLNRYVYNSDINVLDLSKHTPGIIDMIKLNGVENLFK